MSTPEVIAINKTDSTELKWSFGGKAQRGWALYIPLILEAVGTGKGVESPEFAKAVARWQTHRGLRANGIVDQETWSEMIREFQSRRMTDRSSPPSDSLVVVPPADFYDDERPAELRQVERNAYAAYKRMITVAAKVRSLGLRVTASGALDPAEKYLKIISAFRTREHQDRLRQAEPQAGRAGLAVNSTHFTGRALDLYVGGEPVSTAEGNRLFQTRTPVYRWLVKNAGKFGFRPYFYEPWHWEYVSGPQ
ncbi:MAG: M15 family metallopeptidase [Acidobacteriota bacterium]